MTRRPSTLQVGKSGRVYVSRIDGPCSVNRRPRRWAIQAIEWPWFDRIVLILIVINCCFLAMADPTCALERENCAQACGQVLSSPPLHGRCPNGCSHRDPDMASVLDTAELVSCILFTAEALIKVSRNGPASR